MMILKMIMKEARKKKVEEMRNRKIEDNNKIPPPPKLKRSKAIDIKQEIIKSSSESSESSESSTSTDSSNYESDEKTDKIIIHNYDEKEPESKLIIKKVRRKNKINHEELKKIYDDIYGIYYIIIYFCSKALIIIISQYFKITNINRNRIYNIS